MLVDNRVVLREKSKYILERLDHLKDCNNIKLVDAKNGQKTLQIEKNNKKQYIHSTYNPEKEIALLVEKFRENLKEKEPLIFIGFGLGYHIEAFVKTFSPAWFSIVEFNSSILKEAFTIINLKKNRAYSNLKNLHLIEEEENVLPAILQDVNDVNKPPQIVVLPSYERIFKEEVGQYFSKFNQYLKEKKNHFTTTISFQKRWTFNSLKNFPYLLKTPNLLTDFDRSVFENKPAILVAAGPSLNEEFDNLKKIKKDRSAYIFSVGSAINALIEHDIYPDAAFTYDPTQKNQFVFQKIKEKGITDIPMVFGSSVGFETLENYPGKMAHFITSQDYISAYTIKHNVFNDIDIAVDSPSIAIITLQLLNQLNFNPIILVGQNFSYQHNKRFASGIEYNCVKNELNEKEIEKAFEIESVDGDKVLTNDGFVRMKTSMELILSGMKDKTVYNTTKNGAKIKHTFYKELETIITELTKNTVVNSWLSNQKPNYNLDFIREKWQKLVNELKQIEEKIKDINKFVEKIEETVNSRKLNKLHRLFTTLDEKVNELLQTLFYKVFLSSMTRFEYELVSKEISSVRNSSDLINKAKVIVKQYRRLINEWVVSYQLVREEIHKVYHHILEISGNREGEIY
ncbi:motility associated factor glycosyltransferase family protein [Bacillus alveayuensis]|uniref:motility associated factor glycosyltransferase family protein n=1 Tax=Aeribacillus alveayuensis TaxID=279215 RepID=UPI0005D10505|nr:6-hydroxymethylpterin diphosphokinase MptE-like protein [Bacillus alveayuensis]